MSTTEETPATDNAETNNNSKKFVVASQVKEFVKSKGFCTGNDLVEALSNKVEALIQTAILRAEQNGRKTLRSYDL